MIKKKILVKPKLVQEIICYLCEIFWQKLQFPIKVFHNKKKTAGNLEIFTKKFLILLITISSGY